MHKFNTQHKFGEALCYIYAKIDGKDALFTEDQVRVAVARAKSNPEDLPKSRKRRWQFWRRS